MNLLTDHQTQIMFNHRILISVTDSVTLSKNLHKFLVACEFKILNFIEHHFEPQGYTCLWLLGESHLAVHTFPEQQQSYVELSGCNRTKTDQFMKLLKLWAEKEEIDWKLFENE